MLDLVFWQSRAGGDVLEGQDAVTSRLLEDDLNQSHQADLLSKEAVLHLQNGLYEAAAAVGFSQPGHVELGESDSAHLFLKLRHKSIKLADSALVEDKESGPQPFVRRRFETVQNRME